MSTPQPIPGSSSALVHPPLSKKRSSPERDELEQPRDCKKAKSNVLSELASPAISSASFKEKDKKKRRRKKKKMPIAATVQSHPSQPSRRSTSAPGSVKPDPEPSPSNLKKEEEAHSVQIDVDTGDHGEASSSSDKGKARATDSIPLVGRDDKPPEEENVQSQDTAASTSTPCTSTPGNTIDSAEAQITSLKEELAKKTALLNQHQSYISSMQQSLTCEICLDFLYKPFALSPCGHVACHPCLVRWFTAPAPGTAAPPNNNNAGNNNNANVNAEQDPVQRVLNHIRGAATHIHKRKTCPVCRAVVQERPVEVWGMKSMVSALVKSALVELPVPPPASGDETPSAENENNDPWHNIFKRPLPRVYNNHNPMGLDYGYDMFPRWFFPEAPAQGDIAYEDEDMDIAMGVRDDEDGGVYRCPGCLHEIADGECTGCQRIFPGLGFASDEDGEGEYGEDSDEDSDEEGGGGWFGLGGRNGAGAQRDARGHRGIQIHYRGPFDDDFVEGEVEPYPGDEVMGMPINFAIHPGHRGEYNEDDEDEDDESVSHFGRNGNHPILDWGAEEGIGRIEEVNDDDENDEDEDGSYEGSFIDDDGADDDAYAGRRRDVINRGRHYRSGAILDLDEEEDDDVIEISDGSDEENSQIYNTFAMLNRARQGRNNTTTSRRRPGQVINSDSESENMNSDIGQRSRAGRRGRIVDTESDVDIDGDDE